MWGITLDNMTLTVAMSATWKGAIVLLFTGVVAPLIGVLIRRVSGGWDGFGKGRFAIEQQLPWLPRGMARPAQPVDPAIQAAEVRQMLNAKQERLERRGEAPIDVEAETERLLAESEEAGAVGDRQDAELRAEVRQLVVARNERRMRQGLEPLDVEAETERQLSDFVGSA